MRRRIIVEIATLRARVGGDEFRRSMHHVAHAMAIRISVDRLERIAIETARRLQRLDPAGAMLLVEFVSHSRGTRPSPRPACGCHPRVISAPARGKCAPRPSHRPTRNAAPPFQHRARPTSFERVTCEIRLRDFGQQPRVEHVRTHKSNAGALALALEDRKIEPDGMPDHQVAAGECPEFRPSLRKIGSVLHAGCVNAVNFCRRLPVSDRPAGSAN